MHCLLSGVLPVSVISCVPITTSLMSGFINPTYIILLDENPLIHIFKNQVSSLKINFNNKNNSCPMVGISSVIFQKILTIYTNLRCLKCNPSSPFGDALYLYPANGIAICPTLLELHVSVTDMKQCLHILDGRFDQLRILYVTFDSVSPEFFNIEDNVEKGYSQYHIYSYPYKLKVYNNITNNFRGGLFTCVTQVSLYDERPFEHDFFLRIAQSFLFMKELTIKNQKAQNKKQFIKSNSDDQILSIIEYPNLTRLDLTNTHDDYIELFLFDRKMSLPNNLHLCVDYQSLERVTYYFTRYITRNHCAKLAGVYFYPLNQIDENIKNYFPHTCICRAVDFV
ncbi:unnamed protein product [Rotaria sp. Silwood1]|nr:unnamed protein product [Rotaria sp. Silwood1]CAF1609308.1 unnamed protein product [Rotaria sp. Silwood1]